MKKLLALMLALASWQLQAQEGEKRPLSATEYDAVKKIVVQNLEKDTYVKASPFVLDRSSPPFVFKFSDGIVRKVYLYKLYESDNLAELGMVAIYTTSKNAQKVILPIPSPMAQGEIWGKYIDDLKYGEKDNLGLASCMAFVLTKMGVGSGTATTGKEEDKYEYCFAGEALVTMADGTQRRIADVQIGDKVRSYRANQVTTATVTGIQVHQNQPFELTQLVLIEPTSKISTGPTHWQLTTLEATPNHPVWTAKGKKNIGDITVGETLYQLQDGQLRAYEVFVKHPAARQVTQVYNLVTDQATYLVNGVLVFAK